MFSALAFRASKPPVKQRYGTLGSTYGCSLAGLIEIADQPQQLGVE